MRTFQLFIPALLTLVFLICMMLSHKAEASQPKTLKCLADNIFHESRGEPISGQVLVAKTVLNRVDSKGWPNDVCAVVYQPSQFSWTLEPINKLTTPEDEPAAYLLALNIAEVLLKYPQAAMDEKPDHYLRCDWKPRVNWWKEMTFLYQVGDHCFYNDETR